MTDAPGALRSRTGDDPHPPLCSDPLAEVGVEAFLAGLAAVDPTKLVVRAVRQGRLDDWLFSARPAADGQPAQPPRRREEPRMLHVLALGKAAPRMLWGLVEAGVPFKGLGVRTPGAQAPLVDTFRWLTGDHPVPGPGSFAAGREVLAWADALPRGAQVLVLLSGGASACAELSDGMSEAELARRWAELLREGKPVEAMNRERASWSQIKAGRLAKRLLARTPHVRCWLLCDTDPAQPEAVGSGPVWDAAVEHHVLASVDDLVAQAGLRLAADGFQVYRHGRRVSSDVATEVAAFLGAAERLPTGDVALVGGGEATLTVPAGAPPGGRCQHAALVAGGLLKEGRFVALASDGMDGQGGATGAWVKPGDSDHAALAAFAATQALGAKGRLIQLGPTGTNVNDLWVYLRRGP